MPYNIRHFMQSARFFTTTLLTKLYVRRVWRYQRSILLTCGKHLNDIISLRVEISALKTSLTPLPFIEVSAQNQKSERSCTSVLKGIDIPSVYTIFLFYFWTCSTVWYCLSVAVWLFYCIEQNSEVVMPIFVCICHHRLDHKKTMRRTSQCLSV